MPDWPIGLPKICELDSLKVAPVSNSMAIDTEVGEPLTRRRFTGEMKKVEGMRLLTRPQANALYDFWQTELKSGSLRFTDQDPMTQEAVEYLFLAPPQFSRVGRFYSTSIYLQTMP